MGKHEMVDENLSFETEIRLLRLLGASAEVIDELEEMRDAYGKS